jgi:adenosine deaminase
VELAEVVGHPLPTTDAEELGRWFAAAANSGSLERYLETFAHTVAVMQTADALYRVALECALDLAADGVVYAEVRFAPEQHVSKGLTLPEVVEAVLAGFAAGSVQARAAGTPIRVGTLLTAMRHAARSTEIAELAVRYRDVGVVGFDIAGAEAGYPPTRHLDAFEYLQRENSFTIHAGRLRRRRSGRRSSGAARTALATVCASSMTSRVTVSAWAGWRPTFATSGFPWRCARHPTCRRVPPRRSVSIPSACCGSCASGSR